MGIPACIKSDAPQVRPHLVGTSFRSVLNVCCRHIRLSLRINKRERKRYKMGKKYLFFAMCVFGLGIAGAGARFSERTDMGIVRAAQADFDIDNKGTLTKYNGTDASVVIPDGVAAIGAGAFEGCGSVTGVTIPASVTSIGERAFSWCPAFEAFTVAEGNPKYEARDGVLFEKTVSGLTLVKYPDNKKDVSYVIPNEVTAIAEEAFERSSNLGSVTIPGGVTEIKTRTFHSSSLAEITIPDSVTAIGASAFGYCEKLTGIVLPDSITDIEENAFDSCGLISITLPKNLKTIEKGMFTSCSRLETVTLPAGVEKIRSTAFWGCKSLTGIVIPERVTNIEVSAFGYCESLKSIALPGGLTSIQPWVFEACSSLEDVVIPDSVTDIGDFAFWNCKSLKGIVIPGSVANIGNSAFLECGSLEKIEVERGNKKYKDMDGVLFEKKSFGLNLMVYPASKKETVYRVPKKVKSIGADAFSGCSSLTDVILSNGVKEIGSNAFSNCSSLTSLTIPSGVKEIQYLYGAFWGCDSLKNLKMSVKKGNKIYVKVILDEGISLRKPTITSGKTKVATVSKPVYKEDGTGDAAAKVTVTAKNRGKTDIVFQRTGKKNKKIKARIALTVE